MTTKPDFKFGDRVIHIGERQKRGVVSRVFRSGGVWWLAFEGEPDWRAGSGSPRRSAGHGGWTRHTSKFEANGAISIVPWIGRGGRLTSA